ncbi:hypothetical protein KC887_09170 [Candidatus Kaiserbacteria bacterium]|nr:hypothetical protein [Candidatus Kaiserbacteria bacterium]
MSKNNKNTVTLQRMKAKLKIGQLALGATTAIFSSAMARQWLDGHEPWVVFVGGFLGGWTGFMVLDDTLDLYLTITINQWADKVVSKAKKKLAVSTTVFTLVLLIFSGTLTLLSNRVTSSAVVGKEPVSVDKLEAKLNNIDKTMTTEKSRYSDQIALADKNVADVERKAKQRINEAIAAGGRSFEKLWQNGNGWVRTVPKSDNPGVYAARQRVYDVTKEEDAKIDKAREELTEIRKMALAASSKIEDQAKAKSASVTALTTQLTNKYMADLKNINVGLGVAEVMIMLYVLFLVMQIISFCRANDVEFGEPPIGIDGFLKIAFNRILSFFQIGALAIFARMDQGMKGWSKRLPIGNVLATPSIMSIIASESSSGGSGSSRTKAPDPTTPTSSHPAPTKSPTVPDKIPDSDPTTPDKPSRQSSRHPDSLSPTGVEPPTTETPDIPTKTPDKSPTTPDKSEDFKTFVEKVIVETQFRDEMYEIEIEVHNFGRSDYRVKSEWKRGPQKGHARFLTLDEIQKDLYTYMKRAQDGSSASKKNYLFFAAAQQAILSQKEIG